MLGVPVVDYQVGAVGQRLQGIKGVKLRTDQKYKTCNALCHGHPRHVTMDLGLAQLATREAAVQHHGIVLHHLQLARASSTVSTETGWKNDSIRAP